MRIVEDEEARRLAGSDLPRARIREADDWRPLEKYVPTKDFVYVADAFESLKIGITVARRGRHELSYWYYPPPDGPAAIYPVAWKPIDDSDGISVYERREWLAGYPNRDRNWRGAEPVYEPGPTIARLTPAPRDLLRAMAGGAVLHERAFRWSSFTLQKSGADPKKLTERHTEPLVRLSFIERDGVLPVPGVMRHFREFDWKITPAGAAWLAANQT